MKIGVIIIVGLLLFLLMGLRLQWQWQGDEGVIEPSNPPEYTPDYGNIPEPYYISTPQRYGVDVLQEYLQGWYWSTPYEADVFDCTEMSALLERDLENRGFHTYIVGGKLDNDPHTWVRVEAVPGIYVIVESTTLTVIVPGNARYNQYHETDQDETIYDAIKICPSAYDWWN